MCFKTWHPTMSRVFCLNLGQLWTEIEVYRCSKWTKTGRLVKCENEFLQIVWMDLMLLIPCLSLHSLYQPTNALNKTQFMTSIKYLHVSARRCHPHGVSWTKEYKSSKPAYDYLDWCLGLAYLCSRRLPEDGTFVPKHVGVWYEYLSWIVFY